MRKLLHNIIDNIFNFLERDFIWFWLNPILCFFRKPKYKIGEYVYYYGKKKIANSYKDYSSNNIFYVFKKSQVHLSEGLLDFYRHKQNNKIRKKLAKVMNWSQEARDKFIVNSICDIYGEDNE